MFDFALPVKCVRCKRIYNTGPHDAVSFHNDYYNSTDNEDGVCFNCLLLNEGLDPKTTPVLEMKDLESQEGEEWKNGNTNQDADA